LKVSKKSKIRYLEFLIDGVEEDGFTEHILESIKQDVINSQDQGGHELEEDEIYDLVFGNEIDPKALH
jgi:hypothetical protein